METQTHIQNRRREKARERDGEQKTHSTIAKRIWEPEHDAMLAMQYNGHIDTRYYSYHQHIEIEYNLF